MSTPNELIAIVERILDGCQDEEDRFAAALRYRQSEYSAPAQYGRYTYRVAGQSGDHLSGATDAEL